MSEHQYSCRHPPNSRRHSVQRSTSRTGLRTDPSPKSSRFSGERDRSSCKLISLGARRRSNSSTPTTTVSRPCTVTRCGWPAAASRTTSLSRTLASPNFQQGNGVRAVRHAGVSAISLDQATSLVKIHGERQGIAKCDHDSCRGCQRVELDSGRFEHGWYGSHPPHMPRDRRRNRRFGIPRAPAITGSQPSQQPPIRHHPAQEILNRQAPHAVDPQPFRAAMEHRGLRLGPVLAERP